MLRLTLRDLQFRAGRTFITLVVVGVVFAVVLIQTGMATSLDEENGTAVRAFGADAWVVESGVSGPFTVLPTTPGSAARKFVDSGAEIAEPILVLRPDVILEKGTTFARLIGYGGPLGRPDLVAGRFPNAKHEVIGVEGSKLTLGQRLKIGSKRFEVVGITKERTMTGGEPFMFMRLADAQAVLLQGLDFITAILVKGQVQNVKGFRALTNDQVRDDAVRPFEIYIDSSYLVATLLWVAGTGLMGGVTYVAALERLREFAVVKSFGGSSASLLGSLAMEAILIALLAAAVGVGVAQAVLPRIPVKIGIPNEAYVRLLGLSIGAGLVASFGALRRAVKVDPALAFSAGNE